MLRLNTVRKITMSEMETQPRTAETCRASSRKLTHQVTSPMSRQYYVVNEQSKQETKRIFRDHQCQMLYGVIHRIQFGKETFYDVCRRFCQNYQNLTESKNLIFANKVLAKQAAFSFKIKDFLNILSYKIISPEQMIKGLIYNWADQQLVLDIKKFRLDPAYIQAVEDMNSKVLEVFMNLQDDKCEQMTQRIIASRSKQRQKQAEVKQIYKSKQRPLYQRSMQFMKQDMNFRTMSTDLLTRLELEEERIGMFTHITPVARRKMHALDIAVDRIHYTNILENL